ncbi:hypothetical protein LOD99_13338 [Oopsacas minuta]|uniref:Transposase n=1 Tax=Oopsacas minuta TaxID=111878 RepID=A0AAV7KKZ2_9METZ|nr:hypothetical protein LOD99_13338 [Oopsacas minuta]
MSNTTPTPKQYSHWNVELKAFAVERYMETMSFHVTIRDVVSKFNPLNHPINHSLSSGKPSLGKKGQSGTLTQKSQVEIVTQDERGSRMRCSSTACENPYKCHHTNRREGETKRGDNQASSLKEGHSWCAFFEKGIIGPYFFEENGVTTSINSERYIVMLERFLADLKRLFPSNWQMWFQQDGATHHAAQKSLDWLRVDFKSRIIIRKCEIEWPPYSLDLSPQIFSCGAILKTGYTRTTPRHWWN